MAYLGRRGALAALTSADIPDSSITTAKIVDGTVAEGDLAFSTATQAELDAQRTNSSITTLGTVTAGNLSNSAIVYPAGHVIKFYSHMDTTNALYSSTTNILGGASGLRTPASGTNITTSVDNSEFYIQVNVSAGWGGTASSLHTYTATDWGLFIYRNNVSGTTSTRVGGSTNNALRGGSNSWFANDDADVGYNPFDTRSFSFSFLDAPSASAGTTLFYSVGVDGNFGASFPYNRTGSGTLSGSSASTLTIYEIAP